MRRIGENVAVERDSRMNNVTIICSKGLLNFLVNINFSKDETGFGLSEFHWVTKSSSKRFTFLKNLVFDN